VTRSHPQSASNAARGERLMSGAMCANFAVFTVVVVVAVSASFASVH
jgi:hypothetical protein